MFDNKSVSVEPTERKKSISQLLTADFLPLRNNTSDHMARRSSVSLKESTFGVINKLIRGYSSDNDQSLSTIDKRTQVKWPAERPTLPLEQIWENNNAGLTFPLRKELSYNQIRCIDPGAEYKIHELPTADKSLHTSLKQRRQSFFFKQKRPSQSEESDNQDSSCPIYAKKNVVLRRKSVFETSMQSSVSVMDTKKEEEFNSKGVINLANKLQETTTSSIHTPTPERPISIVLHKPSNIVTSSLSPSLSQARKNSVFHEIRVLSPRNSLGGIFYSSSIISIKNSNDDQPNLCTDQTKNDYVEPLQANVTERDRMRKFCLYFKWTTWMSEREEHSLFIFSAENSFRQYCLWLADHSYFDYVVLIFISLNCITLAMERPKIPPWSREREFLSFANYVFTLVFGIEMLIKVVAKGLFYGKDAYFHNGWNIMDGSLVGISLFDIFLSFFAQRSPRIFGILRVFRLLRSLRPLR